MKSEEVDDRMVLDVTEVMASERLKVYWAKNQQGAAWWGERWWQRCGFRACNRFGSDCVVGQAGNEKVLGVSEG